MKITLSPIRMDTPLSLRRDDDTLTINGARIDLTRYVAGESDWIIGQPMQEKGIWQVTMILPHDADAPKDVLFPSPIVIKKNGPVLLPSER